MNAILSISGALFDEGWEDERGAMGHCPSFDFSRLDGCCRYCDAESAGIFRSAIDCIGPEGVHLIDTGDYHFLTLFFLEKIRESFSLVLLDNHPDDQTPAFGDGIISCGGWVGTARRTLPLLKQDLLNNIDSDPALPVYLSIDIDVLSEEYALTGWSQGDMTADSLLALVSKLKSTRRIIGTDICGGIPAHPGKRIPGNEIPGKNRCIKESIIRVLSDETEVRP